MTNGIEDAAMQLFPGATAFQGRLNTCAEVQQHWEVHTAGLVADSTGSDKVIDSLVGARALELVVGKGTM